MKKLISINKLVDSTRRLTSILALCSVPIIGSAAEPITVVGFGGSLQDAFHSAYFEPFSEQYKVDVIEDSYTGGFAKQKAMVKTGNITWDLVQMDENEMIAACDQGILEPIRKQELLLADELNPSAFSRCGVGAFVWSMVSTYSPEKFGNDGPKNWKEFWDVEKWPGKRGLRKQPRMTLEIALLADGVASDDLYKVLATPEGKDRAFAKLNELKEHIIWWESGAQPLEWLRGGIVTATSAYNGRISVANQEGSQYPIGWDGQLYSMDYWTIVKGTKNIDRAYQLLDFMMKPEQQKLFAENIPYGLTNRKANQILPNALLSILPTAPANQKNALLLDSYFWLDHEEDLQQRFTSWVSQN
ncbi:ABC transporter substrate-binding protein [Motiliproteus sp. MSK22-1]|uniref:ABC transporter substrate-binding protein n=1 Tax=Motiliproteus sp. MSK22-1 TaxID=1897630 RepID=UPI0009779401|nr:ABC transporter substrate-binding protein [Motiliproteus sp. MSK22-1]OMH37967.1 spermidine/putrescine ABC transporter substrate-binding protein [Motiliproteus sp. MSK22-1]